MGQMKSYTSDFETTSQANYDIDGYVRVWLWSAVKCGSYQEWHGNDLDSWFDWVEEEQPSKIWFHNLAFDGTFIIWGLAERG